MGDSYRLNKMLLKSGFDGSFDFLYFTDFPFDLPACVHINQGNMSAAPCRIACRGDVAQFTVGNQTQHHSVLNINMGTKRSSQANTVNLFHVKFIH